MTSLFYVNNSYLFIIYCMLDIVLKCFIYVFSFSPHDWDTESSNGLGYSEDK